MKATTIEGAGRIVVGIALLGIFGSVYMAQGADSVAMRSVWVTSAIGSLMSGVVFGVQMFALAHIVRRGD